ncbi:MAG: amidohydrolase family protein [Bryobacterales bacterium]
MGPQQAQPLDLTTDGRKIVRLDPPGGGLEPENVIRLDGCLLLPGLVNAHDHLEFSLFPRLGQGPFRNAREWAAAVYRPSDPPVREHLQIPKSERLLWGGLKNLLGGVTTVCHHNPYEAAVFDSRFPVRVLRRYGWAHSFDFGGDVAARFAATPAGEPFILHLGEATDAEGRSEIHELDAMGALTNRSVLIHGVALDYEGLALIERRGAAVVWCPSSNLFTLGATLSTPIFGKSIPVALATDSALTGEGDLLDELRFASRLGIVPPERLYEMVTTTAAGVLRLENGEGRLTEGGVADLIAIADSGHSPCEALTSGKVPQLLLVMVGGEIKLVAEAFVDRLDASVTRSLQRIKVAGRAPCLVDASVAGLLASARRALGSEQPIRLAGKALEDSCE